MISAIGNQILSFASQLIQIQSYTGEEGPIIKFIQQKMIELGFEDVQIDAMGNLIGHVGSGTKSILFDSHVDTVAVNDGPSWDFDPFGGEVINSRLCGRGSLDMKSSVAASIYAAAMAKEKGHLDGKKIYVSCTVMEEDCDGENLKHLLKALNLRPQYVIICEPSNNQIAIGHKGKAQVRIQTHGVSAHGSNPDKGLNAVYEMAEIINRVEKLNLQLADNTDHPGGTLVLSNISSQSASLNAVPSECEIYLDRRMVIGETANRVRAEMDQLIAGKKASWSIGTIERKSWTGMDINYHPLHEPWQIAPDHHLTQLCIQAFKQTFQQGVPQLVTWDFSTNAVATVDMGIPTIGFGPGDPQLAHARNESCPTQQITDAYRYYLELIKSL